MEDAMTLAKYADSVVVLVRGTEESMKASKIMQDRAKQNPKIKFMFNSEIEEFLGDQFLQSIRIKNNVSGEMQEMPMDGVFMAIGHKPNTDMVKGLVEIDEGGWIKVKGTQTSVPGIFAAGDVADKVYRQAITSAGTGCMALLDAKKWLEHK